MNTVYLVGAGPGDPNLITIKAQKILTQADVVFYDFLANEKILKWVPRLAEKKCVGKRKGHHIMKQEEINELMLTQAKAGKKIVRLKGGTPFLFGKGFEEKKFLESHGISVEIIPGVSAATAVPESFGIPLTFTQNFPSIAFCSGHHEDFENIPSPNTDTVVYFMSLTNVQKIVMKMLSEGWSQKTSCAILACGTLFNAKKIEGTLENITKKMQKEEIPAPALFFVGNILEL